MTSPLIMSREEQLGQKKLLLWSLLLTMPFLSGWGILRTYVLSVPTYPRAKPQHLLPKWPHTFQGLCNPFVPTLRVNCTTRVLTPRPERWQGQVFTWAWRELWYASWVEHTLATQSLLIVQATAMYEKKRGEIMAVALSPPFGHISTWNSNVEFQHGTLRSRRTLKSNLEWQIWLYIFQAGKEKHTTWQLA
jgi:hypothetical protein